MKRILPGLALLFLLLGVMPAVAQQTQPGSDQGQSQGAAQGAPQPPQSATPGASPPAPQPAPATEAPQPAPQAPPPAATAPEAAPATPQEQPSSTSAAFGKPRFMIYFFQAEQDTLSPTERFVLYNSILAAAEEANPDVVILESPDQAVPDTREGKEELARRINADCWLSVSESGGFANLTIQAETYDILRQQAFGAQVIRPGFVVDYRTISVGFWNNIVQTIKTSYARIVDVTAFTVRGVPGTQLSGVPGGPYRINAGGVLQEKIPYPSSFTMTARAGGFYDVQDPLFLGIVPLDISLHQVAKPHFGAEVRLSSFQFPGVRFWWYPIPSELFVRLGITTQLFGFYPIDNSPSVVIVGAPLSQLELDVGLYISPAENLLRFFVGAGGYLRISHPPAPTFSIDTEGAPGAVTLSLGLEYSPWHRVRFVLDYEPAFIFASDPQQFINVTFVANSFPSGQVPGYFILPWGVFDLRNLYLGLRMDF